MRKYFDAYHEYFSLISVLYFVRPVTFVTSCSGTRKPNFAWAVPAVTSGKTCYLNPANKVERSPSADTRPGI